MEVINAFFASNVGYIVAILFIFMGVADIVMASVVFGKTLSRSKDELQTTFEPENKALLEQRVRSMTTVSRVMQGFGALLVIIGIYGITR